MRAFAVLAFVLSVGLHAQRSPFNGLPLPVPDSTGHYRILIGGHFHGASTNRSGFPASTLLANLDTIQTLGADLFLSTGDLFMDPIGDRKRYDRVLFSKLRMPLFNVDGNHDVVKGASMEAMVVFTVGADRFVLLNTEADNGRVPAERFAQALEGATGRVFVVSHRPIWAEEDAAYGPLFEGNTRSLTGTDFQQRIRPIIERTATNAQVYWISGSMGGKAPSSIFFQPQGRNLTYIQCAIRDEPRDALLIGDIRPDGVTWSALSLTGQRMEPATTYDVAWWRAHQGGGEGFNWRLLPYLVKNMLSYPAFWWGVCSALVLAWLFRRLLRRWA